MMKHVRSWLTNQLSFAEQVLDSYCSGIGGIEQCYEYEKELVGVRIV